MITRTFSLLLGLVFAAATAVAEPVSLFDGKSIEGWDFDAAMWRVEDGVITGGSTTEKIKKNDFISTKKSYANFELKLKIKCAGDPKTGMINSGIQIRSVREGSAMIGYQIDCGAGWFGKIYDEHRRNKVIAEPIDAAALEKVVDVFGWNEYRIRAEGPRIQAWINGVRCIDYTEQDPNIALDGHIAPQVHSGGACLVQVKDVTIEELPATPGAPTWESIGGIEGMKAKLPPKPKAEPKAKGQADATQRTKGGRDVSYNAVQGTARTAEEQQKLFKLPPGFEIELVVQESEGIGKFISVYFDQRGRLWTQTALEYPVDANENPAVAEALYAGKGKDKVLVYPRESVNAPIPAGGLTNPTVFADSLAIPLGLLPWGNGDSAYVLHGHDLKLFKDTNGDGRADESKVILTGFGVQDSHLFPHQFTRAPGGWIWMAQGLFNNSRVQQPGSNTAVDWPKCGMARMRPDGSEFEVTSIGPNNIWGLVMTAEGETFIQEANDYGYPVMPFHEYAYYPGGMEALKKSYQPDFPPAAEFRMGGTGLSGLALGEEEFRKLTPTLKDDGLCMFVANPITSNVQTIAMHRNGPCWKLEQATDLLTCDDPFFRPVAMTNGPDGCIYIVDWYNKIISHNEVPRAHPDRDKTRGRIWRVKPKGQPAGEVPDMTQMPIEAMLDYLESSSPWAQQSASDILADSKRKDLVPTLKTLVNDENKNAATRIHALWTWEQLGLADTEPLARMLNDPNPVIRREAARALGSFAANLGAERVAYFLEPFVDDVSPDARRAAIQTLGQVDQPNHSVIDLLIKFAKPSLPGPTALSSRSPRQIPVREAYDREFERFLVRMFLERHADALAQFLDTGNADKLPAESLVLASLALQPKASAARVAKLLPQLDRAPNDEELLRLAQYPEEPGCGEALQALLAKPQSRESVVTKLLAQKTKLAPEKIAPFLTSAAKELLASKESSVRSLAMNLIGGFQLTALEEDLVAILNKDHSGRALRIFIVPDRVAALSALREVKSSQSDLFANLVKSDPDEPVRAAALEALAASRAPDAATKVLQLYPTLPPRARKSALTTLSATKAGAQAIVAALLDNSLPQQEADAAIVERLAIVLANDPAISQLEQKLGGVFREVLMLDGQETAWADSKITLEGPFTVEAWVRLAPNIHNNDSLLGSPGKIDLNFFQSKFRVWIGEKGLHDVAVSNKPMTPDLWTHVAVTRDADGVFRIYTNGELDVVGKKTTTATFTDCRVGWSGAKPGTEGAITELRVWDGARSAAEIRANFDRVLPRNKTCHKPVELMDPNIQLQGTVQLVKGKTDFFGKGARLAKTIDTPPLLTEEQAKALDTKFTKLTALAQQKPNLENGKVLSALCLACHQIGNTGGQIGPNLSGAGAMGLEAVLRNILTPNAAMEPGYRIFRCELTNGDLVDAFYVSEDEDAYIIRQPGVPDRRLPKAEVRSTKYIRRSLMPEGLLDALNDEQARDLLGYLMTLK